jgi:uncharacterized membrane protein YbhN (UPF0104 family)
VALLFAGPVAVNVAFTIAFWAFAHAAGVRLGLPLAALVFLAGTAVANALPAPGGLGAAELALTAALVTVGTAPVPGLAAVLVFRVASFWLPSVAGAAAWGWLQPRARTADSLTNFA